MQDAVNAKMLGITKEMNTEMEPISKEIQEYLSPYQDRLKAITDKYNPRLQEALLKGYEEGGASKEYLDYVKSQQPNFSYMGKIASIKKFLGMSEDAPVAEAATEAAEDAAVKEQLRVAILSGSTGENSKSRALAEAYRKSLEARGAAVDWLDMREMGDLPDVITGDHDKINPYLNRFAGADAYVVASPIYNWGPSGKVKQFLDLAADSDTMTGKPYSLLSGAGSPRSALAMGGLANQLDMELKGIGIGAGVQVAGKEYNKLTGNINSDVTARAKANADTLYDVASALRKTADYPFDTSQVEAFITSAKKN